MKIKIAPSILSADFGKLNDEIAEVEPYSDMLHVDVMDGHFVPNITIGPPVVKKIVSKLPLDVHLMIENPQLYIELFVKAGAASITVHQEACTHLHRVIQQIKALGVRAAVALNPATPVETIKHVLNDLDMVLVMSVNPGFGGQKFIPEVLVKIKELRNLKPDLDIEVDGGINAETARQCIEAGANVLVSGSHIFGAKDRKAAIESLRQ
ncbi:ribulose-phosphate 3-epimerase [Patescibacteria group bacterium]|nr:ribulose-phosphate 3-epimerase [Patescibacteria group bacterium]MBU1953503.1 ribulose-phosphate 3-epimerase [Patescibacteria group bacterium]